MSFKIFVMSHLLKLTACILLVTTTVISCKKEIFCENCREGNKPPVACAGPDQTISLPTNSITVDGNCSADPDNNIKTYTWTKVSGPSSSNIATANRVQTLVTNLVQGVYQFELKVTDPRGLASKDTVQVSVISGSVSTACNETNRPTVNAKLVVIGKLSQARTGAAVAAVGGKIIFAGGFTVPGTGGSGEQYGHSLKADVFDIATQTFTTAQLSLARSSIAAVANGNKIFFAGGETGDGTEPVNAVDMYDVATNSWSTTSLSLAGNSIAAAAVGNKVFFAGGDGGFTGGWGRGSRIDIYNVTTNTWSTASFSAVRRGGASAVTVNNKVYFAGGETWPTNPVPGTWFASNSIDIYDNNANSWSASTLKEGKLHMAAIAVDNKIYWAGGLSGNYSSGSHTSCLVQVMDANSGNSTTENLFKPAGWWIDNGQNAVVKDNRIIFYSSYGRDANKFDIYDITTNTWSIGVLPETIEQASIISVNNTIYLAGGKVNGVLSDKVYKLEF